MPKICQQLYCEKKCFLKKPIGYGHFSKSMSAPNFGPYNHISGIKVINGNPNTLPLKVKLFIEESASLCQPDKIHICDGSNNENRMLLKLLQNQGTIVPLPKYENCWLARTNPIDARVETKTFICSEDQRTTIPNSKNGVKGALGNWISEENYVREISKRFPECMKGRTMYVIPFSMGPIGSPLSKIGVQITDSPYVVCSMRIMTRMGTNVLKVLEKRPEFVVCLHSVGMPETGEIDMPSWPCDPLRTIVLHRPSRNEIVSYGSGYGENALLGKKSFSLRIASTIAKREGWLAEHMSILGITNPDGKKKYIAAAFPAACGKTNLAMLTPTLPGYKIECVSDDIAWMRFDAIGRMKAINPENGFFGVAPGTSMQTNPIAMKTIFKNTIFTNVASTSDGGVFWEGMENEIDPDLQITDWQGCPWKLGESQTPAAHPNSRFCTPASQCPTIDSDWEHPEGVPISAIVFGGRRPKGVPLVYESRTWTHGVFGGAAMRSESTEYHSKAIINDPFAMRSFFGYNFGHYMKHWLSMEKQAEFFGGVAPKIFHVNWFRKDSNNSLLWPGFGENSRVLDWIMKRILGQKCFQNSAIGRIPTVASLNIDSLTTPINTSELLSVPKDFWLEEVNEIEKYFDHHIGTDLPEEILNELRQLKIRVNEIQL